MVTVMLVLILAYACFIWLPRLVVAVIFLMLAGYLSYRVNRTTNLLLQDRRRNLDYGSKPTRAQRRLMRAGLRLAIRRTELRSLLPGVAAQADAVGW